MTQVPQGSPKGSKRPQDEARPPETASATPAAPVLCFLRDDADWAAYGLLRATGHKLPDTLHGNPAAVLAELARKKQPITILARSQWDPGYLAEFRADIDTGGSTRYHRGILQYPVRNPAELLKLGLGRFELERLTVVMGTTPNLTEAERELTYRPRSKAVREREQADATAKAEAKAQADMDAATRAAEHDRLVLQLVRAMARIKAPMLIGVRLPSTASEVRAMGFAVTTVDDNRFDWSAGRSIWRRSTALVLGTQSLHVHVAEASHPNYLPSPEQNLRDAVAEALYQSPEPEPLPLTHNPRF